MLYFIFNDSIFVKSIDTFYPSINMSIFKVPRFYAEIQMSIQKYL